MLPAGNINQEEEDARKAGAAVEGGAANKSPSGRKIRCLSDKAFKRS
jgi:hypothetical protein